MGYRIAWGIALVSVLVVSGCASTPETPAPAAPGGIVYGEDDELGKVWVASGFDFNGYDTLYIAETQKDVARVNPDGVESLEWARGVVRDEVLAALQAKKLFATVVTREADVKPGTRTLRLDSTIVEYERGGGAARYFAGLYGAGQPVIKVRGRLAEGDRPLFAFETRRSGVTAGARLVGGFRSNRDIQTEDIRDLAKGLADFVARTARGQAK